jgi:hypothetical protein
MKGMFEKPGSITWRALPSQHIALFPSWPNHCSNLQGSGFQFWSPHSITHKGYAMLRYQAHHRWEKYEQ